MTEGWGGWGGPDEGYEDESEFTDSRPTRDFIAEVNERIIADKGWLRWKLGKIRARVMVGWRLRGHYWRHPEALKHVSQEAFDAVSNDPNTPKVLAAIAIEAAKRARP